MTRVGSNDHSRYRLRTRAHDGGTRRSCTRGRQTRCELYDLVRAHSSRLYLRERCLRRKRIRDFCARPRWWHHESISGRGSLLRHTRHHQGRLSRADNFYLQIVSDAETSGVTMVLDEGSVKELAATVPPPKSDRVPVTQTNRQGIVDPLTAMLFSATAAGEGLHRDVCRHTLPIFDGQQRYDLKLAFKRMDKVTAEKGYAGPVVVCSVSYEPIAGHRPYPLIKYLSEGREIEMTLAPVAGTRLLAPFRMLVESALANLVIEANQFELTAQPQDTSTVADPKAQ